MSFNQFADSLTDRLFHTVAGGRAVELVDGIEPVKGDKNLFFLRQVIPPGPFEREFGKNPEAPFQFVGTVVDGFCDSLKRNGFLLEICLFFHKEISRCFGKTEKTESFRKFHDSAGFGLCRGSAFSHLLLCADHLLRITPANAEINRDIKTAVIDSHGFFQDVCIHFPQPFFETFNRFFRRNNFVLIQCISFECIF